MKLPRLLFIIMFFSLFLFPFVYRNDFIVRNSTNDNVAVLSSEILYFRGNSYEHYHAPYYERYT